MPSQDTVSTVADAAPESQVDRRLLIDGLGRKMGVAGLEEFFGRKTFDVPALGGQA